MGAKKKSATLAKYLAALDAQTARDVRTLHALIRETVPSLKPTMMLGFPGYGPYHYRYPSGTEGNSALVSVAARKGALSIYVAAADKKGYLPEQFAKKLPKADVGKSCIRIKKLSDLDLDVFADILRRAEEMGGAGQTN